MFRELWDSTTPTKLYILIKSGKDLAFKAFKIYNGLCSPLLEKLISKSTARATRNKQKLNQPSFKSVAFK